MIAFGDSDTKKYFDTSFYGDEAIFWDDYTDIANEDDMEMILDYLDEELLYWERWPDVFPDNQLMSDDPTWSDAN